ncbi:MAG TPA: GNAT family N-acetyltransferase [Cyclobacteriaceae bacterium]|nr:GNAT family N-acetyltransferase [Cyclobacteriaceae bacterium]
MTDYIFLEDDFKEGFDFSYEPWLFHDPKHLKIQFSEWKYFSINNVRRRTVEAQLNVVVYNSDAISPFRAPFGSIQFAKDLKPSILFEFVQFVCEKLKEKGVARIILKNPPDAYLDYSPILNTILFNLGFHVELAEVGAVLSMENDFVLHLSRTKKRKFRQLDKSQLTFKTFALSELENVFKFIQRCRVERRYSLSIDWDTLSRTVSTFGDRFFLFGILDRTEIAAATISINVGNKILYNFQPAHLKKYDGSSPMLMLLSGMHQFCRENGYDLLDLGTSSLEGFPNFKLLDFKLGLGAHPTMKLTYHKRL